MKVKNISGKTLNFKGGVCKDGSTAEVDYAEARFLFGQGFVEKATEFKKPVAKKPEVKKVEKTDG